MQMVEPVLKKVEAALANTVFADAENVVGVDRAVGLDDEIVHERDPEPVGLRLSTSHHPNQFPENRDPDLRIIFGEPLIEYGNQVVSQRRRAVLRVE